MGLLQTITNALSPQKQVNSIGGNDFLKYGNRKAPLLPTWSGIKLDNQDTYRGYSYATIQRKGNRVASLAKRNLYIDVSPEMLEIYQKQGKDPSHPYIKLIEESTQFTTKKFWKTVSVYLDLTGRYYLGVVRDKMPNGELSYVKEFILLNPLEVRRVKNNKGQVAGFVERKLDGRSREWPVHQIITFIEESPFDNDQPWSMVDAAKPAIYTLNQSGDHARQSIHGNLNAPGIITTDVILEDQDFDNFRSRIVNAVKGEPIFGNGSGAIQWQDMQVDLNKAALLDINEINRTEFIAVAGTSKTNLGIEESGTTRETSRVQDDNYLRDTVEPRIEDIIDTLNLDYRVNYGKEFKQTGYRIQLKGGVSKDYEAEIKATELRSTQAELAQSMYDKGYTWDSCVSYAIGSSSLEDLVLDKKRIEAQKKAEEEALKAQQAAQEQAQKEAEEPKQEEPVEKESNSQPIIVVEQSTPQPTPEPKIIERPVKQPAPIVNVNPIIKIDTNSKKAETENIPDEQGWVGAKLPAIDVTGRMNDNLLDTNILTHPSQLKHEDTNIPAEENCHVTLAYGLKQEPKTMKSQIQGIVKDQGLTSVKIKDISDFPVSTGYALVALLEVTPELKKVHEDLLALGSYEQEHPTYRPHITLAYLDAEDEAGNLVSPEDYYVAFQDLKGKELQIIGLDLGDESFVRNTYKNDITEDQLVQIENAHEKFQADISSVHQKVIEAAINHVDINSFTESDIVTEEEKGGFLNQLENFIKEYWLFLAPLFGTMFLDKHPYIPQDKQLVYRVAPQLQEFIEKNAETTALSHLNTVLNDVLKASNKAYNEVLTSAAIQLIQEAYDRDPERFVDYFKKKPTDKQVRRAIDNTDILEQNRKIYDKANKLALEGYDRQAIVKSIRDEFNHLTETRANTIARHETSRAYVQSQYDADRQMLQELGQTQNAFKQMFSRSGEPCEYCQTLIDRGPIPFEQNFLNKGGSLEIEKNGKTHTFTADYEDINAGTVHVNCNCAYKLIIRNGEVANAYVPDLGDNIITVTNNLMNKGECTEDCCKHE